MIGNRWLQGAAAGVGAAAAAVTAGLVVERRVVRTRRAIGAAADELGSLRGEARTVRTDDGVELFAPDPASDAVLRTVHTPQYLDAVQRASVPGGPETPVGHGLDSVDNPIFEGMHQKSALIAGGSVAVSDDPAAAAARVDAAIGFIMDGLRQLLHDDAGSGVTSRT